MISLHLRHEPISVLQIRIVVIAFVSVNRASQKTKKIYFVASKFEIGVAFIDNLLLFSIIKYNSSYYHNENNIIEILENDLIVLDRKYSYEEDSNSPNRGTDDICYPKSSSRHTVRTGDVGYK